MMAWPRTVDAPTWRSSRICREIRAHCASSGSTPAGVDPGVVDICRSVATTLLRLSLNVASTRVVLLHGHTGPDAAGKVIEAFGHFLVGGNFAVGVMVFIILVLINFMVITKGAGRIAEVGARFMLDAMPGKQMAIDADLNAGLIGEDIARKRRTEVAQEAVANADDVQKRVDSLKKDGRKSALLLVANAEGELRFIALSLQ